MHSTFVSSTPLKITEQETLTSQQAVDLTTATREEQQQVKLNSFGVKHSDINQQWIDTATLSEREQNLQELAAMGFWNFELNSTLLDLFNDDLNQTVAELVR